VRAVTAWSAFGAFDWASLLTRAEGLYEPGLFDVRGPRPRPTALARMVRELAERGSCDDPALDGDGWWRVPSRLLWPGAGPGARRGASAGASAARASAAGAPPRVRRPVLITGGRGTLAQALARACEARGLAHVVTTREELDVADAGSVRAALERHRPWAIVNAAGYVRVDDAERERVACWRENACGPQRLAEACAERGVRLATVSSDLVFDGATGRPYVESDRVAPLNAYGASKAAAEAHVLERCPDALVVRTSAFFGPWDEWNFVTIALRELAAGRPFDALDDVTVTPTYVPELTDGILDLLVDGDRGIWHLANDGPLTWAEFARLAARRAGLDESLVRPVSIDEVRLPAARPRYSALGSERGRLLGSVENAICHYLAARPPG
jgi:dTDP-4-dehydrorhamnose reductase